MKKYLFVPLFILLSIAITSCQSSSTSQLEATNEALRNQVNTLMTQLTQVGISPKLPTQPAGKPATEGTPSSAPSQSPTAQSAQAAGVISPALIYSGSGTITPWTNKTLVPNQLFGAANVHMICDPNGTTAGKMWIDKETETASCGAKGEAWTPWKQDITIGDHYIYSANANDKYEFWTIGTTPFTIRNRYSSSDFIFVINKAGIYNLSANLIKGEFNVYLTCQEAQNFTYKIIQSTTIPVVILNPATCMIIIRDVAQAQTSKAEIEVSFEFEK